MSEQTPARIIQVGMGFMAARTLQTAVQFDLFTILSERSLTAEQIRKTLDLNARAIPDFTDALVALGFLDRKGEGPVALYSNTAESATFLDRNSPQYTGGVLDMASHRTYGFWNNLPEALRTGKQQNGTHKGEQMFDLLYRSQGAVECFSKAMAGRNTRAHRAFASMFDFQPYKTLLDLGGASATLSCEVAKANQHMTCTSFDLPPVLEIAKRAVEKNGLSDRVRCEAGDYFKDEIPEADIIVMGMILHDNSLERKKYLMRKVYEALGDGGVFVAIDMLIDDARRERTGALLMSLNMLIEFGEAADYSGKDFKEWSLETGFRKVETMELVDGMHAAIAYK